MAKVTTVVWDELPGAGRLGRAAEHDERSRAFAVEVGTPAYVPGPVLWPRHSAILNQGRIGSCTGNAMASWLGCEPHCTSTADAARWDEAAAVKLYELATRYDRIPGYYLPGDPASEDTGSTGTAVAKAAKRTGLISSYGWAFTTWGLLHALQSSPILIGSVWLTGMDRPDRDGFVSVTGEVRGGHEYLVRGYEPGAGGQEGYLIADNSWGTHFGVATDSTPDGGSFKIRLSDWETLRNQQADVTVPKV